MIPEAEVWAAHFSPTDVAKIEEVVARFPIVEARNETISTASMARPSDPANLSVEFVDLRGIEPPFPLVGNFVLSDGQPFDFKLLEKNGAVVARIILEEMNLGIGQKESKGPDNFSKKF